MTISTCDPSIEEQFAAGGVDCFAGTAGSPTLWGGFAQAKDIATMGIPIESP
jgi:hypothetical protein